MTGSVTPRSCCHPQPQSHQGKWRENWCFYNWLSIDGSMVDFCALCCCDQKNYAADSGVSIHRTLAFLSRYLGKGFWHRSASKSSQFSHWLALNGNWSVTHVTQYGERRPMLLQGLGCTNRIYHIKNQQITTRKQKRAWYSISSQPLRCTPSLAAQTSAI